ncbi:protein SCO1/2 [Mucilaginibacter yixingensis]|uniref:Protein SCO1/2 n=1 Tax=Mucilaginibacter yixingensis TaxID=1295612 RepID=A0A2T5J757_9SPHI|nr:SCO family protein [Mucilaginibacter yixingensis]PTQ94983.1 protein SCO1/2 [Mucilaginibacter yixingensis]
MKKILILVAILAVPGFLYYLLTVGGKNRYKPLPFYGPKQLSGTFHKFHGKEIPDTLYHTIPDFNLTDQDGKPASFKTIGNKITVFSFFYTHCTDGCDVSNGYLDSLAKFYAKNKLITFASITVDPQRDKPEALKQYAAKFNLPSSKWLFLTGDTSAISALASKGLLVDALQNGSNDFIYSKKLILVDPEHRIRGYYNGTDVKEVERLNDEMKVQIAEELRKIKAPDL